MNMNTIACVAITAMTGLSLIAADAVSENKTVTRRRRRPAVQSGGLVVRDVDGPRLHIVDAQTRVEHGLCEGLAMELTTYASLPWRAFRAAASGDAQAVARAEFAKGAAGVVAVVDAPDAPALLVAPEEGWSAVNVAKLAEDGPSSETLKVRLRKELWRAAAWAVGGGNSAFQPCLLKGVSTMKELDAVPLLQPGPEPNNKMIDEAHRRGVKSVRFASYRQACREGWAPAPTNDVQKAIWEKVKADKERGPTNPITIPPPNQKK